MGGRDWQEFHERITVLATSNPQSAIRQGKYLLMIDLPESLIRDTRKLLISHTHLDSVGEDQGFAWA